MSIRVTTRLDAGRTVVHIAGRFDAGDLDELAKLISADHVPRVVDLSELQSADAEGARMLRELVSSGSQIRGASPYIEMLLKEQNQL